MKRIRKYVITFWIFMLFAFGMFLLWNPLFLNPDNLAEYIRSFGVLSLVIYGLFFFFRGIFLVPSTPLILVGMLLFPDSPNTVFFIAMIGILFSAFIIYEFSDVLGLDDYFAAHVKNEKIKKAIEKYGFYAVTFWSFFLVLPTDVVCYLAGAVRMNLAKFLLAVMLGEGFIIGIFIYGGGHLIDYLGRFF